MRKLFLGAAAFSLLLATGCQNEEIVQQTNSEEYTLTFDMGAQSRTLHNDEGECIWGENEQLLVVGDGGKVKGTLTLKSKTEGGKKAVFSGKVTGDPAKLKFMVYPVPQEDGTIPMGDFDGVNHNAPMTGSIEGGVVDSVEYAGGLVRMVMEGAETLDITTVNSEGESATSGAYTFNPTTGELVFKAAPATAVAKAKVPANGVVYVPVAPVEKTDGSVPTEDEKKITISVKVGEDAEVIEIPDVTIEAESINTSSVPDHAVSGNTVLPSVEVSSIESLIEGIEDGKAIELTANIDVNQAISLTKDVIINGNGHTIRSTASRVFNIEKSGISVSMLRLNMVNASVNYGTADNYLAGVRVAPKLENVALVLDACTIVYEGERAKDWAYAVNIAGNTKRVGVNIQYGTYEGANVINVWGQNHNININGASLHSKYMESEKYKGVCAKIDENEANPSANDTLRIKNTTFFGENALAVENKGGSKNVLILENNTDNTVKPAVKVGDEVYKTLEEAALHGNVFTLVNNLRTDETFYIKADQNYRIDLNGFEIVSKAEVAIVNSGNLTIDDSKGDGAIMAGKTAICHQTGNLKIYGGSYQAYNSALKVLSGHIYLYKGDFYATAKTFSADREVVGAAVSVESTNDFKGGHIRTKEGTFKGVYALYLKEDITLSVHGGNFIGKINGKNQCRFIGLGTFSEDPTVDTDYLNENAKINKNETTGMWEATGYGFNWWKYVE